MTDVISSWDLNTTINAIMIKRCANRDVLSTKSISGKYPKYRGWLYMEAKPGKWSKRFFVLRESTLFFSEDKGSQSGELPICSLSRFDVYHLSQRRSKTPTKFVFALRSQDSPSIFQNKLDYVKFFCAEDGDKLKQWIMALRMAKVRQDRVVGTPMWGMISLPHIIDGKCSARFPGNV